MTTSVEELLKNEKKKIDDFIQTMEKAGQQVDEWLYDYQAELMIANVEWKRKHANIRVNDKW